MSESNKPVSMGFKLFPPPSKPNNPSRKPSTRRYAINPQSPPHSAVERPESPDFPLDGQQSALDGSQNGPLGRPSTDGRQSSLGGRQTPQTGRESPIAVPSAVHHGAGRSNTSSSETPTLVRGNSNPFRQSIAKTGLHSSPPRGEEPVMRSIFPRYNPDLPLEHQQYFPTQASPTHIPREIINRRPYSPNHTDGRSPLQSPGILGINAGSFPRGISEEPVMEPSSNEEMKQLWKVVNGWRVQQSEGRTFCMRMSSAAEEPVHTLSSATHPFYTLRLNPTSTSAQMTMLRHDPSKTPKRGASSSRASSSSSSSKPDAGIEVLGTTLEETARRFPPNDGLVALLYPRAASKMVIELANNANPRTNFEQVVAAAEHECGRLVWDEDSRRYYLVHPAVSTPFVVSIFSSPAWSKVEYVLEHEQLPRNLARLVRDGAGAGFLEVDTGVAAKIDCFYIVDVAVCALMLVAIEEEKKKNIERFEAPPVVAPPSPGAKSSKAGKGKGRRDKETRIEEFEMDLESQESSMKDRKERQEKVPGFCGLLWMLVKCLVWSLTMLFKATAKVIIVLSKCLTRRKS